MKKRIEELESDPSPWDRNIRPSCQVKLATSFGKTPSIPQRCYVTRMDKSQWLETRRMLSQGVRSQTKPTS